MKSILFDWSGVVRDTVTNQMWIVNRIFAHYGVAPISTEEFREHWQQPPAGFYKEYLPEGYREEDRVNLFRTLQQDKDCPPPAAFGEVVALIRACKERGHFLAVVSSDFSETLIPEVTAYGLDHVFDEIVTDADHKLDAVRRIMRDHHLDPAATYFVGDSNHEIDVARDAGITSVAVTWGFTSERKLNERHPDFLVHDAEELGEIIL